MGTRFTISAPRSGGQTFAHAGRSALAAVGLGLLSLAWLPSAAVQADEEVITTAAEEGSLLVARRDESTNAAEDAEPDLAESVADLESLQPVSQSADRTPELADGSENDGAEQFGDALAEVAQPKLAARRPLRSARRTVNAGPSAPACEPVKFQGITAGKSTRSELVDAWGNPDDSFDTPEGTVLSYAVEPFESVEALISEDGTIAAIKVTLATALEPGKLARQLSLSDIDPVTVMDDQGQSLGQAFPERGVLFVFEADGTDTLIPQETTTHTVTHVVIQPLDAPAFALRAKNRLQGPYEKNIQDLQSAIALDPEFAEAHWLLAKIYMATGQAELANEEAAAACELEPGSAAYDLRSGQTLAMLGEYDDAVLKVRAVLDHKDLSQLVRAQALHQMAKLAALGDVEIASKAIPFYERAVEIADRVATSEDSEERRAAKELLVDAHAAIAEEIARQAFNQKVESLSLWIGRASALAEDYIASDGGSVELRLLIAQRALAALASFKPTLDPSPWVAEAEEAAQTLLEQSDDELWQQHVKWELGIAYHNALRVEHARRETAAALRYGQQAIQNLAEGAARRQAVHASEQLVGQLYFHMGAVHAVHEQNHAKAMQWYDKAAPLLNGPRPVSELYSPRREGEMLVSIGVSCWQLGQQARALELTKSGASLVELAVEDGILARSALAVPYGNLATMYQQMGENTNAAKYSELAKNVAALPAKATAAPRVSRIASGRRAPRVTIQAAGEAERPFVETMRR